MGLFERLGEAEGAARGPGRGCRREQPRRSSNASPPAGRQPKADGVGHRPVVKARVIGTERYGRPGFRESIDSGVGCGKRPIPGPTVDRQHCRSGGNQAPTTRRNIVYDNKTAGAPRSVGRSWSRAVMGLAATGALLLAGATQAHAAAAGHHSSNTGRAITSLAGHRYEAMSPGARLRLAQAPEGLRSAMRDALGRSGAASTASAIRAKLLPRDASAQNLFGTAIAVSGTTAIVGATTANGGPGAGTGAAYVFVKGPAGWTQQAKLAASDPAGTAKENFGFSVVLVSVTEEVGAPNRGTFAGDPFGQAGAAYVFQRSGTKWSQQAILTDTPSGGGTGDFFGWSVAISGGTVLASAIGTALPGHDVNSGAVFEYVRSGATWPQTAQFTGADTQSGHAFGWDVALAGNTAVIGAPRNSPASPGPPTSSPRPAPGSPNRPSSPRRTAKPGTCSAARWRCRAAPPWSARRDAARSTRKSANSTGQRTPSSTPAAGGSAGPSSPPATARVSSWTPASKATPSASRWR